jgi:hypothetical protein
MPPAGLIIMTGQSEAVISFYHDWDYCMLNIYRSKLIFTLFESYSALKVQCTGRYSAAGGAALTRLPEDLEGKPNNKYL